MTAWHVPAIPPFQYRLLNWKEADHILPRRESIADVVEILKTHDFYRPAHATIFDTILDLYGRGEPADGVTVAAALADTGDLQRPLSSGVARVSPPLRESGGTQGP